jgi:hypothetical protein
MDKVEKVEEKAEVTYLIYYSDIIFEWLRKTTKGTYSRKSVHTVKITLPASWLITCDKHFFVFSAVVKHIYKQIKRNYFC